MKVEIKKPERKESSLTTSDLRSCQWALGLNGWVYHRIGSYVLQIANGCSISIAGNTVCPIIEILPPGTQIILTVED